MFCNFFAVINLLLHEGKPNTHLIRNSSLPVQEPGVHSISSMKHSRPSANSAQHCVRGHKKMRMMSLSSSAALHWLGSLFRQKKLVTHGMTNEVGRQVLVFFDLPMVNKFITNSTWQDKNPTPTPFHAEKTDGMTHA